MDTKEKLTALRSRMKEVGVAALPSLSVESPLNPSETLAII